MFSGVVDCDQGKRFYGFLSVENDNLVVVIGYGGLVIFSGHR